MSKYTTEVRYICETYAGMTESVGFADVGKVIADSRAKVFDFEYPIFDENYRAALESKILLHYYTQEIGLETVGLWKLKMQAKLNDIMPYYNQLYKSELLTFNPLVDVDLKTQRSGSSNNESTGKSESVTANSETSKVDRNSIAYNMFSDTPQGGLEGVDTETYLSSAGKVRNDDSSEGVNAASTSNSGTVNNNISTTEQYIEYISGKNGGESYAKKLIDFRKSFLNIDMMIIRDLRSLFMYLW